MKIDPLIPALQDNAYLAKLIAEITAAPPQSVLERLRKEHIHHPLSVSEAFYAKNLEPYVWSQGLLEHYEETDSFIYGIVVWNRSQIKCAMRTWMLEFLQRHQMQRGRILICGDGIGLDSFFFAQAGYEVVFHEVSKYGQQIAKRLFDDYNVKVQIADSLESFPPESFDAIFSLDVLEHVPSPPAMVRDLTRLLKPGGFFVVSAPFYAIHPKWPTHLKSNRQYSGKTKWLEQSGNLRLIDGCTYFNPLAFQKLGGESVFSLPTAKRISLTWGSLFLRFSGLFPALILNIAMMLHRRDPQLKRLMPSERSSLSALLP